MTLHTNIRLRAAALLAGLSLALSSCFVSPGKFTSELTLLENNQFTFTYEGEVYFLALSKWVEAQQARTSFPFEAYCYGPVEDDDGLSDAEAAVEGAADAAAEAAEAAAAEAAMEGEAMVDVVDIDDSYSGRRDCTPEEVAEQRAEWEESEKMRQERNREKNEQLSQLIGGINPSDPNAEAELAKVLLRQKGFNRVVPKGDGLFEVSYSISGTLNHDYLFPMMEDFPTSNPFVQLFLREGNVVRINAPGYAPQSVSSPMMPFMAAMSGIGGGGSDEFDALSEIPAVEGTFTIITSGEIRANNTDEGPVAENGRQRLTWVINDRTSAIPTALIALSK